jgi:glutamate synthase (NADPH/NADH) small chain
MKELQSSQINIKADLILLAMGFLHTNQNGIVKTLNLNLDIRGNIKADVRNYLTSSNKVFTAGDSRRGQSLVVWAIKEGRECAAAINGFLLNC